MSRVGLWVRAAAAVAVLAVLSVAPPLLLARYVGNPWPAEGVDPGAPLTDGALIGLLAVVCWMLWAQLVVCVVVEAAAAAAGSSRTIHVPVAFTGQQYLARRLVTAALAVSVSGSAVAAVVEASSAYAMPQTSQSVAPLAPAPSQVDAPEQSPGSTAKGDSSAGEGLRVVQVARGDTLWSLARDHLGSGQRWSRIADLNDGRAMPDGRLFRSADLIQPGWVLLMPPDAPGLPLASKTPQPAQVPARTVTVAPGDTLSQIALDTLGDAAAYPDIAAANRDLIADPDQIDVGWRLSIPSAVTVGTGPADTGTPDPDRDGRQHPPAEHGKHRSEDEQHAQPDRRHAGSPPQHAPTPSPESDRPEPANTQAPRSGPVEDSSTDDQGGPTEGSEHSDASAELAMVAGGAVLAAGMWGLLVMHRHRQFRHRRSGRSIGAVPDELRPVEQAVMAHGPQGSVAVDLLQRALGQLAVACREQGSRLPDVMAVRLTDDMVELVVQPGAGGATSAPAPWSTDAAGTRWRVGRPDTDDWGDTTLEQTAPYPLLVTVGSDDTGAHWLIDLEHAGAVTVAGDRQPAQGLCRAIAAELAVNAWSRDVDVRLVGFGDEMVALNPDRLRTADGPEETAHQMVADIDRVQHTRARLLSDVLVARRDEDAVDAWRPQVLMVATDPPKPSETLQDCAERITKDHGGRTAAALVAANLDLGRLGEHVLHLRIDAAGRLSVAGIVDDLQPRQLPTQVAADMAALMTCARDGADEPMPAAEGSRGFEAFSDAAGGLRPDWTIPRGGVSIVDAAASSLPLPDEQYQEMAATTPEDLAALAPMIPPGVRDQVFAADPVLDEDVAQWHDPAGQVARLRLLGPVQLWAHGDRSADVQRRIPYYTEVVAYLATRDHGAPAEQVADAFGVAVSTIYSRIGTARAWLGIDPRTGGPYLPESTQSPAAQTRGVAIYETDGLLVDADLFKRLRIRGHARGQDGIADLEEALRLVAGRPFDQLRKGGYRWLAETPVDQYLVGGIVDVAHLVTIHALSVGDLRRARAATEIAILAAPYEDKPHLDLAAVQSAAGHRDEAQDYLREAVANRSDDGDAPMALSQRTEAILTRRHWLTSAG